MRIGVIGSGKMGQHHIRIYSQMKGVDLVGIADISEVQVRKVAAAYNTLPFTDYRDLLALDLDAVSIVVPTIMHHEAALDAIESGCHILVEKPLADTIDHGMEILNAVRTHKRKLLVGHVERFNPAVRMLKEILDEGTLGEIASISSRRVGPYSPRITDSGVILDLGPHDIDVISYLYGDRVAEVYAIADSTFHRYEDHASLMLKFNTGRCGMIEISWLTPHRDRKLNVVGSLGVATLDFIEQSIMVYDKNWAREAKVIKREPLLDELEYFVDVVRGRREPLVTGEDSLHALAVALKAEDSCRQGRLAQVQEWEWNIDYNSAGRYQTAAL